MEPKKTKKWVDLLVILALIAAVYILCQPLGRSWSEEEKEMYTGEEGVYAADTDTHFYLRKAKEFTENGFSSLRLFFRRADDPLVTAVQSGDNTNGPILLSAIAAFLWYVLQAIGIKVGIFGLCMHLSAVFLALCTVPLYLFLKKRLTREAAAFAALLATLAPPYYKHSICGFFDTDSLICLFALIIILSLYECVVGETAKERIRYGIYACVGTVLLALSWVTFYIYAVIAVGTAFVALLVVGIRYGFKERNIKIPILFMAIITVITCVLGAQGLLQMAKSVLSPLVDKEVWPGASAFISEMERPGLMKPTRFWDAFMALNLDMVSYFGGLAVALFFLLSFVIGAVKGFRFIKKKENPKEVFLFIAVGIWTLGTTMMAFFGIRFMQFVILPGAIVCAYGFYETEKFLFDEKRSVLTRRILYLCGAVLVFAVINMWKPYAACILCALTMAYGFFGSRFKKDYGLIALLAAVLLCASFEDNRLIAEQTEPYVETPTVQALTWIRNNTAEDAVIADFWSLGYIYQYYSGRRTLADGGTYDGEFFYWLAGMLTTEDPKMSAGIARMLQNCGIDASEYATELCQSKSAAADLLKKILPLGSSDAEAYLSGNTSLTTEQIGKLLSYTHPASCPDMYLITNYDMVRLAAPLRYYAEWDFTGNTDVKDIKTATRFGEKSVKKPETGKSTVIGLWRKNSQSGWFVNLAMTENGCEGIMVNPNLEQNSFAKTLYVKDGEIVSETVETAKEGITFLDKQALIVLEEDGMLSAVVCDVSQIHSVLLSLYLRDWDGDGVFEKVYEATIPESVSGEKSGIQRRIGTEDTRSYINNGIVVWKIHFD